MRDARLNVLASQPNVWKRPITKRSPFAPMTDCSAEPTTECPTNGKGESRPHGRDAPSEIEGRLAVDDPEPPFEPWFPKSDHPRQADTHKHSFPYTSAVSIRGMFRRPSVFDRRVTKLVLVRTLLQRMLRRTR